MSTKEQRGNTKPAKQQLSPHLANKYLENARLVLVQPKKIALSTKTALFYSTCNSLPFRIIFPVVNLFRVKTGSLLRQRLVFQYVKYSNIH